MGTLDSPCPLSKASLIHEDSHRLLYNPGPVSFILGGEHGRKHRFWCVVSYGLNLQTQIINIYNIYYIYVWLGSWKNTGSQLHHEGLRI